MHSITHSLAHRGPGASRARSRWQPYSCNALNTTTSPTLSRSPYPYVNTPSSAISSSSSSSAYISPAILTSARPAQPCTPAKPTPTTSGPSRDHKYKYVAGLVDQAVKSLCDIWQPEDIPVVFRAKAPLASDPTSTSEQHRLIEEPLIQHTLRNVQLPSPISPSTRPSPISTSPISATAQIAAASCRSNQVIPIRGFVHEVLRRSRTSTNVLQTALCYLEAVRSKVPDLIAREKAREENPDLLEEELEESRIIMGDIFGEASEDNVSYSHQSEPADYVQTVRLDEAFAQEPLTAPPTELLATMDTKGPAAPPTSSKKPSSVLPPLPPLPSPLLCPRRTFLACLILASKFLQDRSYSNKAWAKLAGLPPREIGRCERAVGEALEWRLWVGKAPTTPSPAPAGSSRSVARCRSEASLQLPTCAWLTPTAPAALFSARLAAVRSSAQGSSSGLRRSATVPEIGSAARVTPASMMTVDSWMAASSIPVATSLFSAEPDVSMNMNVEAQQGQGQGAYMTQVSASYGYIPSPPVSTPLLTYSPMSTASNSSSDDGDRTVQLSGLDIPLRAGSPARFSSNNVNITGPDYAFAMEQQYANMKLAAFNPTLGGSVRLPPLSEAVSNPVLTESMIDAMQGVGDSIAAYNTFGNWSVSG